jgi:hypothetical protein
MEAQGRVQVVLGEAERADGLLRFLIEAEGFDLVGLASNDEELERVLRGARPAVVVLDGGISAAAALHVRECVRDAALVVVWPDGVSSVLAEERVEPSLVIEDLGDAVRRAADRVRHPLEPIIVPEAEYGAEEAAEEAAEDEVELALIEPPQEDSPPVPEPRRGGRLGRHTRKMQVLVAAATWFLAISALAAIATAVPHVMDTFRGGRNPGPSPSITTEPEGRTDTTSDETSGQQQDRCADAVNGQGNNTGQGNGTPVRAQGCPPERDAGGKAGGGRPDDPGNQGDGHGGGSASANDGPSGGAGSTEDPVSPGGSGEEHGASETGSSRGTEKERGRSDETGRSDRAG